MRMDIVGQLQEGMRRFSAQESRVATFYSTKSKLYRQRLY